MSDEFDDDLRALMEQLDEDEAIMPDEYDDPDELIQGDEDPKQESPSIADVPKDASDVRVISSENNSKRALLPEKEEDDSFDTAEYQERLDQVTQEVLDACRGDRQEAQDVINMCRTKIENSTGDPARMWVDALVKSVEVKSNINQTAVKMLETNAKFLAALKPKIGQQNNTAIQVDGVHLQRILSDPVDETDV